jgi:bacillithiol system protein YtxJ
MGLFSSFNTPSSFPWKHIASVGELEEIFKQKNDKAHLFFKHSTRCSISSMALREFEQKWDNGQADFELYFIDLLRHRDVSNRLAELSGVQHQSPQVIVVKGDKMLLTASHDRISASQILRLQID